MEKTPFKKIIHNFERFISEENYDKALNQLHHISSQLNPQNFHTTNYDLVLLLTDIFSHVLPYSKHRNDKIKIRILKFLNHWFHVIPSFLPEQFFLIIQKLYNLNLGKYMETAVEGFVKYFRFAPNQKEFGLLLYNIVNELEFGCVNSFPEKTWEIIKENTSEELVYEMIRLYIDHSVNEKGIAILILKNHTRFLDILFEFAQLSLVSDCLTYLPNDLVFDPLTISARLSDEIFIVRNNISLAFQIIPKIIRPNKLDEIQSAYFKQFWPEAEKLLNKRNSASALYALHCAWKHKLVTKDKVLPYLKLDDHIEPRFRLASFQIGIDFIDDPDFRPKMLDAITEFSFLRESPLFCCLVDNLNWFYTKISTFDDQLALSIVNNVMNPIPYDDIVPLYVLKFLNSVEDLTNPGFLFNIEEVVYKYMNITNEQMAPELRKLIKKADIMIDFKRIDWFDLSILLSLMVADNVDPALLHELLIFDYIHISLASYAIDLITKSGDSLYFEYALGTLVKIVKGFGFNPNNDLEKYNFRTLWFDTLWISESTISHSFHKMSVCLPESNLGKVAISLANYIIATIYEVDPHKEIRAAVALIGKYLLYISPEVSMNLIVASRCENKKIMEDVFAGILKRIDYADPIEATNFLIEMKGEQEALSLCFDTVITAVSVNYELAQQFAPHLDQPLANLRTFEAFQNIPKHKEWIEKCKKEIPADQWIILSEDEPFIEEEIKEKAFELKPITIEKGIEHFGCGNKIDLITFFYFSKTESPIPLSEIEPYVMDHADDIRLVVGFFYYALKHDYHTKKTENWAKIIPMNGNELNLYAGALFLSTLKNIRLNNAPVYLIHFIQSGLKTIGYSSLSKKILTFAFRKESGMNWFYIRSIINLDINYFSDEPLITVEFADPSKQSEIFINFFNKMPVLQSIDLLMSTFISLTHVYFAPAKIAHIRPYPLAHVCLYHLKYMGTLPPPLHLSDKFIDSLLAALEKQSFFPIVFFTFFAHVRLNDKQFKRVHELLEPRTSASGSYFMYLLPAAYFDRPDVKMVIDEKAAIYFSNKPPSFSRAFYRSLMMPFTPMFPQKLIVEMYDLLSPVFPPFSYNALNTLGRMNNYDRIIFQKYPKNAMEKFKIVSNETVDIYISTMCDPLYKQRKDITREVVVAAFSAESNPRFALDIVDAIHSMGHGTGFKNLLHDPEIVNMPNFLCFCLVFHRANKSLQMPNLKQEVVQLIEDPQRKEIFMNLNKREYIDKLIHHQY